MNPIDKRHGEPIIKFLLFGTPSMDYQGRSFTLPRRQARAILFRLAAANQPVPREELADLIWSNKSPAAARRNLTRLLSYLRGQLSHSDLLQVSRTAVALNPDLTLCDVVQFTQLCAGSTPSDWQKAVALYHGPFLAGFTLNDNYAFDNWLSQEQRRLERHYLETLRQLVICPSLESGKAMQFARKYLEIDDLAEDIHRQLIALVAANGDRSAALRQYEQCVIVLERELGVPPLPETRAVYEAVRDGRQLTPPPELTEPIWATLPSLDLPLIGREEAWEALETVYGRFCSGGVIFISGEPGVGKSRLMQDFATAQSSLTLTGNNPAGSQAVPYEPLVQSLRLALPLPDRWRHAQPIWLAEAARLLPELHVHFSGLPAAVEVEPAQAQARLFEALTQLLRSLATDSPLLLCLDDVHWADEATLGWLQYVTKRLVGSQICIIATYRTHEAAALREWRRALGRANLMMDVVLDGLSETAVFDLLSQTGADIVEPEQLAARIHAATGGNAFFVLETVRELLETNQLTNPPSDLPLPSTVREAILRRAGRLSPLAQQILEITAVLSPLLTFPIINQAAGRGDMETAEGLEELAQHHLLRADDDRFRFQHDLAREAVYQNISSWRQRLLHRRAANTLDRLPGQEDTKLAATIAIHFEMAGEIEQAIAFYQQAAIAAQSLYAHQEAIDHLQRAVELTTTQAEETSNLPQLHDSLAYSLSAIGEFAAAEAAYRKALNLLPDGDPFQFADLARKLAATLPPQHRSNESEMILQSALQRLDEASATAVTSQRQSMQLKILLSLMDALYHQFRLGTMTDLRERIEPLLDEVGTPRQRLIYAARLGQISLLLHRSRLPAESLALAQESVGYAQELGDIRLVARHQYYVGFTHWTRGDLDEAVEEIEKALITAEEYGDSWLQNQCLAHLNILYRMQGNTNQVEAQLPRLIEVSQSVGYNYYIGIAQANAAWLHFRAKAWLQAREQAETAMATWAGLHFPFEWLSRWILLALALRQNRLADAIVHTAAVLDLKQQKPPDEIDDVLVTAVSAYEANDEVTARDGLETAIALATQHGYL
jgi:DNA-binding SARP family transcriptional activator